MSVDKEFSAYSDDEWAAYYRGQVDALKAWYTDGELAADIRSIWSDSCEGYCLACLDSDYPRNVVIADVVRAVHVRQFGAIRRAAWIARELDREAVRVEDEFLDASDVYREARQVRRAIRAAIRSPKA